MIKFNIFFLCMSLGIMSIVFECRSQLYRNRCPTIRLNNGRVRLRSSGRVARISCNWPYMLIKGNEITTCVLGEWDEYPICATGGCNTAVPNIPNGRLDVSYNGAKIEVQCDPGYTIDGPSFIYCNQQKQWNEDIKGCKQLDEIFLHCNFESTDERFCGWQNDNLNGVDWLADKMSFLFSPRRHVTPGSSQYFTSNYISLDISNYGPSTYGRLLSPILGPVKSNQRCLIFSYKVTEGSAGGILRVSFGGIPHWSTNDGEGRVIIGLYGFNYDSKIAIEGRSCKVAIDNLFITEGDSCTQKPYEEEIDTCNDNCGIIISNDSRCSCDWECQSNNNCCQDIRQKCPYIKSSEQITRYLKESISNLGSFTKIVLTTSKNDQNITDIKSTINSPQTTTPKIIYSTFPHPPLLVSTVMPNNITVTTDIPKTNIILNFNHTSFFQDIHNTKQIITSTTPSIFNISNSTSKLNDTPSPTSYSTMANTTSILINISNNSTIKPGFENTFSKIVTSEANTTTIPTLINPLDLTAKPKGYLSSLIISYISPRKGLLGEHNSSSTFRPLVNNTTRPTIKLIKSTTIIMTPIQYNITTNIVKQSNSTKFTTDLPQKITQKLNMTENKLNIEENVNKTTTKYKELMNFDIFHPNSRRTSLKYDIFSKYNNVTFNNHDLRNITTEPTSRIHYNFNMSRENVINLTTTIEIPHAKPELNYSLHNQHMQNADTWLTEHVKQNDNSGKYDFALNAITIIKYIAVIGIIFVTFKYTFSFITWHIKKPTEGEMNSCFVNSDTDVSCHMELLTPNQERIIPPGAREVSQYTTL